MTIKKRTFIRCITFLCAAALLFGVTALTQFSSLKRAEAAVNDSYRLAFADLSTALKNLGYALTKSEYASTPYSRVVLAADIGREAGAAETALSRLPSDSLHLDHIAKLFSQVSDYAFTLARRSMNGQEPTEAENAAMASFRDRALALSETVEGLGLIFSDPDGEVEQILSLLSSSDETPSLLQDADESAIGEVFLAYDGRYSDDLFCHDCEYLASLPAAARTNAIIAAASVMGVPESDVTVLGRTDCGDSACLVLTAHGKGVYLTERGGLLCGFWSEKRPKGEATLTTEEAGAKAEKWMRERGYGNVRPTYLSEGENTVTFSFVAEEDGVYLYPDVFKVTVETVGGEIVAFDAASYLKRHVENRELTFTLTEEEALAALPDREGVTVRRVLLPGDGMSETCCYELRIPTRDGAVLVYINAENGREEKILMLVTEGATSYTV